MFHPAFSLICLSIFILAARATYAQSAPDKDDNPPSAVSPAPDTLPSVTVSASALASDSGDMITPVDVLDGETLIRQREASLGGTLGRQPGINATAFGAGASRPIIRGMDGARVRVLSDGAVIMDASLISPDHAVAIEPMLTRRIEVLRGPSALAYGGGAIGGVINVLDDKIPDTIPVDGIDGHLELRGASAANEAAGAFSLTAGKGSFAIHAEGLKRDARDYRVGSGWEHGGKVGGSYNQTDTGSLGLSWIGDRGYFGVAYTGQRNEYGLPGHDHSYEGCHTHGDHLHCGDHDHGDHDHGHDHSHGEGVPYVDLRSDRWDARGELYEPFAGFARLKMRASHTDYRHDEIEAHSVSTRFKNQAHDAHLELEHNALGGWRGVIGLQTSRRDFSALGRESYLAPTLTRKHALFVVEEYRSGDWRFEAGMRHERQDIDVDAAWRNRSHRGTSVSLGAVWHFAPQYSAGLALSRTQRLPSAEELYADGLHMATSTYELGNAGLDAETARNIDLTLRKHEGNTTFSLSAFHNRIADYIYARTLDTYEALQLIEYAQHDAVFTGMEGQIRRQLTPELGVTLFGDYVRARLTGGNGNRNLPRIPAYRAGMRLDAVRGQWQSELEWYRVGTQNKTADHETPTPGYNMLNFGISRHGRCLSLPCQIYFKADNLTDRLAYHHASFIKHAAPLTGRNLTAGLRMQF